MAERDHLIALRSAAIGYEQDYAAWLDRQIALLRAGRFDELDMPNLLDEVESLGRSDFKGFVSAVEIVLLHMLKWDHQPTLRTRSWQGSILEHRRRIARELKDSPSYSARIDDAVERAYEAAQAAAVGQTGLPLATFPDTCPYDWEAITSRDHPLDD
ncbi:DUF29 domain-containing protein [Sphingomonas profundi]|uniref:DUF29 domain-containing protein n=1 Tax=Alterirhizorhabdus profundi TaxID=2681549 RepID=UPI0012E7DF3D|nr:DUF29 domain-containing protein [Sphingomonas profundi]